MHEDQQTLGYLTEQYQCHDYFLLIKAFGIELCMRHRGCSSIQFHTSSDHVEKRFPFRKIGNMPED